MTHTGTIGQFKAADNNIETINNIQANSQEIKWIAKSVKGMTKRGLGAFAYNVPEQEVIDGIRSQMTTGHLRLIADYLDGCGIPDNHLAIKDQASGDWIPVKLLAEILGIGLDS